MRGKVAVTSGEDKPTRSRPGAPFISRRSAGLASNRLALVLETMMLAQRLSKPGLSTTGVQDSTNLSQDAVNSKPWSYVESRLWQRITCLTARASMAASKALRGSRAIPARTEAIVRRLAITGIEKGRRRSFTTSFGARLSLAKWPTPEFSARLSVVSQRRLRAGSPVAASASFEGAF